MIEKADQALAYNINRYFHNADKPPLEDVAKIAMDLAQSVRLEEGIGSSTTPEVRCKIVSEIAVVVYRATDYYDIHPSPSFGLTYPWGEKPPKKHVSADGKSYIIATADMNDDYPEGIISFSPIYFEALADYMAGKSTETSHWGIDYPVVEVGSHEVDHLDKFIKARADMKRDLFVFATEGMDKWANTPMEKSAKKFGRLFHQQYDAYLAETATVFDSRNINI